MRRRSGMERGTICDATRSCKRPFPCGPPRNRCSELEASRPGRQPRTVTIVRDCRFTAIDFESAGAAPGMTDAPVQVGLAEWSPTAGHGGTFMSYLRTDQPVTWAARKVHGIGPG